MADIESIGDFLQMLFMGPQYFTMRERDREREAGEKEQAEADKEEKKREAMRTQFIMSMADPGGEQVGTTFGAGAGPEAKLDRPYSVFGEAVGGEPVIQDGRVLTSLGETVQELGPDMNPDDLYWLINAGGGFGELFEPEAAPELEEPIDIRTLGLVHGLMREEGFMPDVARELFGSEAEDEIQFLMANPDVVDALLMPEEVEPEVSRRPAGLMGGYGVIWNEDTGRYEFQPLPGTEAQAAARPTGGRAAAPAAEPPAEAEAGYSDPVWHGPTGIYYHQNLETEEWEPLIQIGEEGEEAEQRRYWPDVFGENEFRMSIISYVESLYPEGVTPQDWTSELSDAQASGIISQEDKEWIIARVIGREKEE